MRREMYINTIELPGPHDRVDTLLSDLPPRTFVYDTQEAPHFEAAYLDESRVLLRPLLGHSIGFIHHRFDSIDVIEDTPRNLIFRYNGNTYHLRKRSLWPGEHYG